MDEKQLREVARELSFVLKDFEYFISDTFLPWMRKMASIASDVAREGRDLHKYVKEDTLEKVRRQRKEIENSFSEEFGESQKDGR